MTEPTNRTIATNVSNAQWCSIKALQHLRPLEFEGPFEMYLGAEHYEVVLMECGDDQFLVAPGGCITQIGRRIPKRPTPPPPPLKVGGPMG